MREREAIALFTEVDRTQDPGFGRRFLDVGNFLPDIRASKPVMLTGSAIMFPRRTREPCWFHRVRSLAMVCSWSMRDSICMGP